MEKKISDYLHLYIGATVEYENKKASLFSYDSWSEEGIIDWLADTGKTEVVKAKDIKLILRPLNSITDEEMKGCGNHSISQNHERMYDAKTFIYLLSKHFDIFGLIESGLAININTTNDGKEK